MLKDKMNKEEVIDLNVIDQINEIMIFNGKNNKRKEANFDAEAAVKWFLELCPENKETLNEISYFIKLSHLIKNI